MQLFKCSRSSKKHPPQDSSQITGMMQQLQLFEKNQKDNNQNKKRSGMGNSLSQMPQNPSDFNENEWDEDSEFTEAINGEIGMFKTYRNRRTDEIIDCYRLHFLSQKDFQYYLQSFNWRLNEDYIVRTRYLEPEIQNQLCSTAYSAKIYIEHPKTRLSDFKDIPYPDNLYCLCAMLEGYEKLFDKCGRFPVSQQQVAIDQNGKIRVWLNTDLSRNYPSQSQIQFKHQTEEEMEELMVDQIVQMITVNTDDSSEPEMRFIDFYQKQKETQKISFSDIRTIIEEYTQCCNIQIPNVFQSVVEIYKNQDNVYDDDEDINGIIEDKDMQYGMEHDEEVDVQERKVGNRQSIGQYASIHEHPETGFAPKPPMYSFNSSQQHPQPHQFVPQPAQPLGPIHNYSPFQAPFTPIHPHTPNNPNMMRYGSREALHHPPPQRIPSEPFIFDQPEDRIKTESHMGQPSFTPYPPFNPHDRDEGYLPQPQPFPSPYLQRIPQTISQPYMLAPRIQERKQVYSAPKFQRRFYYTVDDEIELDPEIAADMLIYI